MRRPYGSSSARAFLPHQALQQAEILFVAIWREVKRCGNARELFLFDLLLVFLHEALVGPPGYSGGFHRVCLTSRSSFMRLLFNAKRTTAILRRSFPTTELN